MNSTFQNFYWISKISMKLTVDFAERYNGGWRPFELYALPRIFHSIKQKVSKTQTQLQDVFVHDLLFQIFANQINQDLRIFILIPN